MPNRIHLTALAVLALAAAPTWSFARDAVPDGYYPVTVKSCNDDVTFESRPERAVANAAMVEMMFDLGLRPHMVGYGGTPENLVTDAQTLALFEGLTQVSTPYLPLEPLLGVNPDFVFSGWNYGFGESAGVTPAILADNGIKSYVLAESCRRINDTLKGSTIEDLYTDLRNLGTIFAAPEKAEAVVAGLQAMIEAVQAKLPAEAERDQVVMAYFGGEDAPYTVPALPIGNDLITLAGGRNAFGDLQQMYSPVTWEEVAARDPDVLLIIEYSEEADGAGEKKWETFKAVPGVQDVNAVVDGRYLLVTEAELLPGMDNAKFVERLARELYPENFQ